MQHTTGADRSMRAVTCGGGGDCGWVRGGRAGSVVGKAILCHGEGRGGFGGSDGHDPLSKMRCVNGQSKIVDSVVCPPCAG